MKGVFCVNKLTNCKTCGAEIAASAKVCPSCGAKQKKPVYLRPWFYILLFFAVGLIGTALSEPDSTTSDSGVSSESKTPSSAASVSSSSELSPFEGDCGITASAEIGPNIINLPEISMEITNTTDKDISAIQFYIVPYDVYGDKVTGFYSQEKLSTDTTLSAGSSNTISWQLLEQSTYDVDLYIYSVYFSDGTEWGNRKASKSTILKEGVPVEVTVNS